ncbi:hypothetical protein PSECIP111951_04027 [Pseudoalteromonas holothuriae]|uniref:DUF3019 domain-containing protein n=1 Tax=Pseudoalteromonas holothuriae TaxID=2963714 RepID=A0A9W4VTW9_9GAMM|nr:MULTISPECIES: DUF3019 domain-containing protein [unclassified Pseudoalteromonas]CAH9062668.1 hypothetical protein PSECIP111854_03060 [Pseudoalteromonas sp. CIP111854]CAH9068121.1 hypothetical protein PSECIP111951_04027 [Pseudoalteromonas sp. CIP111951]
MNFKAYFAVALILVLSCTKPLAAGKNSGHTQLTIKPVTCIVRQLGELCQMTVQLYWQNDVPTDACLYQGKIKLKCWHAQQKITEKLEISLQKNMVFRLFDSKKELLAQQKISVNATMSRQYRRRLKTDWSIF